MSLKLGLRELEEHQPEGPREHLEGIYEVVSWVEGGYSPRILRVWPSEGSSFKFQESDVTICSL